MAKIGNIEAANSKSEFDSGAAFLLHRKSPVSIEVDVDSNSTVEVSSNNPFVVARTKSFTNAEEAFATGHKIVQQGLDILSITGIADLATRDAWDERIVWWNEDGNHILRCVITPTSTWDISAKISNGDGSEPVKPEMPNHHRAFTYFRSSQITEYLFDAYRNMYLAFELLLSSHVAKRNNEYEIDWLKRGLRTLDSWVFPTIFLTEPDPVQATIDTIYKDVRLPLFHAKDGKVYYKPYGSSDERDAVASALESLTELVLNLAKLLTGRVRGMGARMNKALKDARMNSTKSHLSDAFFIVSDDDSPYDSNTMDLRHQRYGTALRLDTSFVPDLVQYNYPVMIGRLEMKTTTALHHINRIEIINDTSPLIDHLLPVPLYPEGIDILECQMNMRELSARAPKQIFPS